MNKLMNKISLVMAIGLSLAGMTACSEPDDLITDVEYNRLFSPTELEAKVQNTTGVKLTWFALSAAKQYNIEIYADDENMSFSGTPISFTAEPATDAARSEISWVLPAGTLEGETTYSVRVKATGNNNESKWTGTTFETGTEQIFNNVPTSDITKTSVTLTWPAGTAVTRIDVQKSGEVIQTKQLSAEEIAAGRATIENLKVESTYTFYIYNGEKQRGKIQVATLPNYTPVANCDELLAAIAAAEPGEVIMLTENAVYDFTALDETTSIKIEKDVVLNTNNNATIKGVYFQLFGGASLEFANITLDGEGGTGDQAFNYKDANNYAKLYIHDAEIKNFTKGFYYVNVAAVIDNITINNCLIHDIICSGGDFMDARTGTVNNLSLTNTTLYNCATACRNIVRDNKKNPTAVIIDHCTFVNCMSADNSDGKSYPFFNMQCTTGSVKFTNNLLFNSVTAATSSANHKNTPTPTFNNNVYSEGCKFTTWDTSGYVADPQFKDAANADFTITNDNVKDKEAGDPRWLTAQ